MTKMSPGEEDQETRQEERQEAAARAAATSYWRLWVENWTPPFETEAPWRERSDPARADGSPDGAPDSSPGDAG